MITDNIFKIIEAFFVDILFQPFDALSNMALVENGWWLSNSINIVFILINAVLLLYWFNLSLKFKRSNIEDSAE